MRKTLILTAALLAFGTAAQAMPDVYGGTIGLAIANGFEFSNGLDSYNGIETGNGVTSANGMIISGNGLNTFNGMTSPNGNAPTGGLGLPVQDIALPGQPVLPVAQ